MQSLYCLVTTQGEDDPLVSQGGLASSGPQILGPEA